MYQKTFTAERRDFISVVNAIKGIISERECKKSVLFLFAEIFDEVVISDIIGRIRGILPETEIFGTTNHYHYHTHTEDERGTIIFSLICFESSDVDFVISDLGEVPECVASMQVVNHLKGLEDVKGIFLFSSGRDLNSHLYMENVNQHFPEVPIFGVSSAMKSISEPKSYIFHNDRIIRTGFLAVIFYGEDLCLLADEEFGWTPLGKKMTVTKVSELGKLVEEIDGEPAANVYKKYFGLSYEQINIENVCEFPIYRRVGQRTTARICTYANKDGSVRFVAPFKQGDEIKFSYGNPDEILHTTEMRAKTVSDFRAQALFLVICRNRIIFLGKDQEKEVDFFRKTQPELVEIHGNSELFFDKKGGSELNSAIVYFAMREGKLTEERRGDVHKPVTKEKRVEDNTRVPLMRRLLTFLDVTTHELDALQQNLSEEVKRKTQEIIFQQQKLNETNRHIVMTLSNAIDAKDTYTNGHSRRVAEYSREISRRYGYSENRQDEVYMIGLLHDVGKIGIPDAIINKPGKLTDEEFAIIKTHPSIGAEILKNITEFPEISSGARWHHERYDGKGYPDGLKGEDIPEIAQIISVADAYDAMTSRRSYRNVMPQEKVRSEIENGKGTQFTPKFAEIMLEMIDDDKNYEMRGN